MSDFHRMGELTSYVVLAHTAPDRVHRLVDRLRPYPTYVHVDAGASQRVADEILGVVGEDVHPLPRYRTSWGSWGLMEATLEGLRQASSRGRRTSWCCPRPGISSGAPTEFMPICNGSPPLHGYAIPGSRCPGSEAMVVIARVSQSEPTCLGSPAPAARPAPTTGGARLVLGPGPVRLVWPPGRLDSRPHRPGSRRGAVVPAPCNTR